jgi:hypothetical protein
MLPHGSVLTFDASGTLGFYFSKLLSLESAIDLWCSSTKYLGQPGLGVAVETHFKVVT